MWDYYWWLLLGKNVNFIGSFELKPITIYYLKFFMKVFFILFYKTLDAVI